jgi:hypothetical protein
MEETPSIGSTDPSVDEFVFSDERCEEARERLNEIANEGAQGQGLMDTLSKISHTREIDRLQYTDKLEVASYIRGVKEFESDRYDLERDDLSDIDQQEQVIARRDLNSTNLDNLKTRCDNSIDQYYKEVNDLRAQNPSPFSPDTDKDMIDGLRRHNDEMLDRYSRAHFEQQVLDAAQNSSTSPSPGPDPGPSPDGGPDEGPAPASSLIDDFADVFTEMPDYFGGDD